MMIPIKRRGFVNHGSGLGGLDSDASLWECLGLPVEDDHRERGV